MSSGMNAAEEAVAKAARDALAQARGCEDSFVTGENVLVPGQVERCPTCQKLKFDCVCS